MTRILLFFSFLFFTLALTAQSKAYIVKGGLSLGTQNWNSYERDPLFKYHGTVAVESAEETQRFSVFAQVGYHVKGSALRNNNLIDRLTGNVYRAPTQEFRFNNVSLMFGGKQRKELPGKAKLYYYLGIRGEYTVGTNLDDYIETNIQNGSLYFPDNQFVEEWNYGVTAGGGFEFPFSDLIGGVLDFSISPDFSFQYRRPAATVWDPFTGNNRQVGEQTIRNITFEVSLGIRMLQIIEYID